MAGLGDFSGLPPELLEMLAEPLDQDTGYLLDMDFEQSFTASAGGAPQGQFAPAMTPNAPVPSPFAQAPFTPQMQVPQSPMFQPSTPSTPAPPPAGLHSTTDLINQILKAAEQQSHTLQSIRQQQAALFNNLPGSDADKQVLVEAQYALMNTLQQESTQLKNLVAQHLLSPGELHRIDYLQNELALQSTQLQLYYHELDQLRTGQALNQPLVTLAIVRQPFPTVPSKGAALEEDSLVVQLLMGATVSVQQCSPVKAVLVSDAPLTKGDAKLIENDTQMMERQFMVAKFPLVFKEGTRKASIKIRFEMDVEVLQSGRSIKASVESVCTKPFVVMTNQKQWEACERPLLQGDAFGTHTEITWNQFANALQRQFIRATKQDPSTPARCMSIFDFTYIHDKFLAKRPTLFLREYDAIWNWYGKCMQVIKYQRHMAQLWQGGLMYGYMTRQEVDMALRNERPGTFIMRFSERHPGQIGIAYVGHDSPPTIKHYLVQPNDTAASKVTLPDFLRDKPQFRYLRQYTMLPSGHPHFTTLDKDEALGKFYSKRYGGDTSGSGYDPLSFNISH